jgi:ABC-type amino acid transport substrate-binding protein
MNLKIAALFFTLMTHSISASAESITISAGVPINWDRLEHYHAATETTGCEQIDSYALPGASRGLSEMLLICQALHLGGIRPVFEFQQINTYARLLRQVSNGELLLMMESVWKRDADPSKVFISDPILRTGEFEVGLFTLPSNTELLKARTVEDLRRFKAASNRNWAVDWETLEFMGIEKINVSKYPLMFKMVEAGRADFMLEAFSSLPDMSQTTEGVKLIPVPNIKIGLKGSRHIVVNKALPNSQKVFNALQAGLKILREKGVITRAYQESGFLHENVRDWNKLCCEEDGIESHHNASANKRRSDRN